MRVRGQRERHIILDPGRETPTGDATEQRNMLPWAARTRAYDLYYTLAIDLDQRIWRALVRIILESYAPHVIPEIAHLQLTNESFAKPYRYRRR